MNKLVQTVGIYKEKIGDYVQEYPAEVYYDLVIDGEKVDTLAISDCNYFMCPEDMNYHRELADFLKLPEFIKKCREVDDLQYEYVEEIHELDGTFTRVQKC